MEQQHRPNITLCLSGGGFRAMLFHLGVIRYLADAQLLERLASVFSVSGGSILAAHLAVNWSRYLDRFDDPAHELISFAQTDVRGRVLRRTPWLWIAKAAERSWRLLTRNKKRPPGGFPSRTRLLEGYYRRLLGNHTIASLHPSGGPLFYVLATSMTTGGPCWFSADGFSAHDAGDTSMAPTIKGKVLPLARAVAASSAYAPFFSPVLLDFEDFGGDIEEREWPHPVHLTDGGVFDNLGLNAIRRLSTVEAPKLLVVSDASAQLDWRMGDQYWFVPRIIRATDILMHRVASLEREHVETVNQKNNIGSQLWLVIKEVVLSKIRTDLDRFSRDEIRSLVFHGYEVAQQELGGMTSVAKELRWDPCPRRRLSRILHLGDLTDRSVPVLSKNQQQLRLRNLGASRFIRAGVFSFRDWFSWLQAALSMALVWAIWILWSGNPLPTRMFQPSSVDNYPKRFTLVLPPSTRLADFDDDAGSPLAVSPDGRFVVMSAVSEGRPRLLARPLSELDAKLIPGTERAMSPFFSDDGVWLAFVVEGRFRKMPFNQGRGGPVMPLCEACSVPRLRGASWVGDEIVFAPSTRTSLFRFRESAPTPEPISALRSGEVSHRWPAILPGNEHVVFSTMAASGREADRTIAVVSKGSREPRTLARRGTFPKYLSIGHLGFVRSGALVAVPFDVRRAQVRGIERPLLSDIRYSADDTGAASYDVSRTGLLSLVQSRPASAQRYLLWLRRTGWQEVRAEVVANTGPGPYRFPRLAPNGTQLAVTIEATTREVWTFDLSRGAWSRLTFENDGDSSHPVWSPDSRTLALRSNKNGLFSIYRMDLDLSQPMRELARHKNGAWLTPTSISPTREMLFSEEDPANDWDIGLLPGIDEPVQQVDGTFLSTRFAERFAVFSPDGRGIAYVSNQSGRAEVWLQSRDGKQRIPVSSRGGVEPAWSRDGKKLFYREGSYILQVQITDRAGGLLRADKPQRAFPIDRVSSVGSAEADYFLVHGSSGYANYDVATNGRFLVVGTPTPSDTPVVVVIPEWFIELTASARR